MERLFFVLLDLNNIGWVLLTTYGPRQANLVLISYASSEGSGEPAHPRSLARTFAARSYKQWVKRNLQTESQIRGPSEQLGMRGWNLSWRNARRHKFAWRGSYNVCSVKWNRVSTGKNENDPEKITVTCRSYGLFNAFRISSQMLSWLHDRPPVCWRMSIQERQ